MGNPAQSVFEAYRDKQNMAHVPELNPLWRAIKPLMHEIDRQQVRLGGKHAVQLNGGEMDAPSEPRSSEPCTYLGRSGEFYGQLNPTYPANPHHGLISVGDAMWRLGCTTLEIFHDHIRNTVMGHLRHAQVEASGKATRMSDARAGIAGHCFNKH